MRPIEEFVYVTNQALVADQASLMRCYYPLIGTTAYSLYQYLLHFYDNGNHRHKFSDILNHTGFGMQAIEDALAVLTAVDLVSFYKSAKGYYVLDLKAPLSVDLFLNHAVYRSLLEQKIGEPALEALRPGRTDGLQDLSKRFSEVFTDAPVSFVTSRENQPKNSFDLSSFRNRMQADGLTFTDEKTDVPELYKISERYQMTWYDTYLLAKRTAVNHRIIISRMTVYLDQVQAQKQSGDQALTETEERILRSVQAESPRDYLQGAKGSRGRVTQAEQDLLTDLAQRGFLDEVINLMVAYSLGRTNSTNLNKEYLTKLANDFAYKGIGNAKEGLLALRSGYERKKQTTANKSSKTKESNVPKWSNPNYDNQTSQADQAKLDEIKRRALAKLADQGKE